MVFASFDNRSSMVTKNIPNMMTHVRKKMDSIEDHLRVVILVINLKKGSIYRPFTWLEEVLIVNVINYLRI